MERISEITGWYRWQKLGAKSLNKCTLVDISQRLLHNRSDLPDFKSEGRTRAAVAMVLSQGHHGLEMLFIQRAAHDLDPWSGHIAFPGGKLEAGELEWQAACRETFEETGISLEQHQYLGRLSDIVGANLPVVVSCCLYLVDRNQCVPVLNEEVRDLFWVAFSDLSDPGRHLQSSVAFGDKCFNVPAIRLPVDDKPVLWGITYRLVKQFFQILEDNGSEDRKYISLPAMVEINEEVENV